MKGDVAMLEGARARRGLRRDWSVARAPVAAPPVLRPGDWLLEGVDYHQKGGEILGRMRAKEMMLQSVPDEDLKVDLARAVVGEPEGRAAGAVGAAAWAEGGRAGRGRGGAGHDRRGLARVVRVTFGENVCSCRWRVLGCIARAVLGLVARTARVFHDFSSASSGARGTVGHCSHGPDGSTVLRHKTTAYRGGRCLALYAADNGAFRIVAATEQAWVLCNSHAVTSRRLAG